MKKSSPRLKKLMLECLTTMVEAWKYQKRFSSTKREDD